MTSDAVSKTTQIDVLFKMYQEHCTHGRHHETQRSTVSTIIIAIAAGVTGLVKYDKAIDSLDFPLSLFLIALGLFGAVFCFKQTERFRLHTDRARKYRDAIDELLPDRTDTFSSNTELFDLPDKVKRSLHKPLELGTKPIKALKRLADAEHVYKYPKWHNRRLTWMWLGLHLCVAVLGIILSVITRPEWLRQMPH
jgi:hypothetical protein